MERCTALKLPPSPSPPPPQRGERAGVRGKDKKRKFLYNRINDLPYKLLLSTTSGEMNSRLTLRRRSFGKLRVIVVPRLHWLSTRTLPPCSSITRQIKFRPNPTLSGWVVKKGSKIRFRFFLAIPCPRSVTATPTFSPSSKRESSITPRRFPSGFSLMAARLFSTTW